MKRKPDWFKIRFFVLSLILSGLGSYFAKPLMAGNGEAINVIVTAYSILAGFLVGIITFIGDPKSLPPGGWQAARLGNVTVNARLRRHTYLFSAYLMTLGLIFISMLLKKEFPFVNSAIEYAYLFLAIFSFACSLVLPSTLLQLQRERIEQEIQARRQAEGIDDSAVK